MSNKDYRYSANRKICSVWFDRRLTRVLALVLLICVLYAFGSVVGLRGGLNTNGLPSVPIQQQPGHAGTADDASTLANSAIQNHKNGTTSIPKLASARPKEQPQDPSQSEAIEEPAPDCRIYAVYSMNKHGPFSTGAYNLSFQRPVPKACRKFKVPEVEETIERFKNIISDPDLYRLFENSYPNTLDTAVKFKGYAQDSSTGASTNEELTFIITGDINAMWLRDSANQMQSYLSLLKPSSEPTSLASLYRGVINLQARYISEAPFCNSFQAPAEARLIHRNNTGSDRVHPKYDALKIWECKYELDSLAAFLQISTNYFEKTGDYEFFSKYKWVETVKKILQTTEAMKQPTRDKDGRIIDQPYTFTRASRWGDTLLNGGKGSPVRGGTGLVRSAFRPSDDACIYQLFIPGNMMYSRYLNSTAAIMDRIGQEDVSQQMRDEAAKIRAAIEEWGVFQDKEYGRVYAFEIDGFGSINMMDDANIPSLLSAPLFGYVEASDKTYQNTRRKILSNESAYFSRGPFLNAMGGPHDGPGKGWPMARIVGILTTDDDHEIEEGLAELVSSTAGLGLIHESINTFDQTKWTRQWFSWANGLFGQMILDLEQRQLAALTITNESQIYRVALATVTTLKDVDAFIQTVLTPPYSVAGTQPLGLVQAIHPAASSVRLHVLVERLPSVAKRNLIKVG